MGVGVMGHISNKGGEEADCVRVSTVQSLPTSSSYASKRDTISSKRDAMKPLRDSRSCRP